MINLFKRLLIVRSINTFADVGLLALRLGAFLSLFIKHGLEKVDPSFWAEMKTAFPDPAHIGHVPSLLIATVSDAICSVLLVVGFFSRLAAIYVCVILSVAWAFTHHFVYLGKGLEPKHGELIVMYITVSVGVALLGPGKYSLDYVLWTKWAKTQETATTMDSEQI